MLASTMQFPNNNPHPHHHNNTPLTQEKDISRCGYLKQKPTIQGPNSPRTQQCTKTTNNHTQHHSFQHPHNEGRVLKQMPENQLP